MEKDMESLQKEEKKQKRIQNISAIVFLVVFLINLFFLVPTINVLLGSLHAGILLVIEAITCLLTSAVPIYLLVKSSGEMFEISRQIKSLEEKEEYEKLIENIKFKFEVLSREQQLKLLNFIKEEVSIKEVVADMSALEDKDIELLQQYFEEEILFSTCEDDPKSEEISLPIASTHTTGFVRTRNMLEERKKSVTAADYNENGQLQY